MISNIVIVHGCNEKDRENIKKYNLPPQNQRDWLAWIKKKLEEKHVECFVPLMPKNWNPDYEEWKKEFEKINIDENSILIGHSAGGGFLVRWLGETKRKIKKLILVAPAICHGKWLHPERLLKFEINKQIRNNVREVVIFVSDDDSEGIKKSVEIFSKTLNVNPIVLKEKGHFTGHSMGTNKFPELLENIFE